MKKNLQLKKETRSAFRNVGIFAFRFGYSREHISRVLHGKAAGSKRLLSALAKAGIEVEAAAK